MTSHDPRARFVLHDHRRPSPHFDLRLEEAGGTQWLLHLTKDQPGRA